jgi:hypothetical protein
MILQQVVEVRWYIAVNVNGYGLRFLDLWVHGPCQCLSLMLTRFLEHYLLWKPWFSTADIGMFRIVCQLH